MAVMRRSSVDHGTREPRKRQKLRNNVDRQEQADDSTEYLSKEIHTRKKNNIKMASSHKSSETLLWL